MSYGLKVINGEIIDTRCPENKIFNGEISVAYTLLEDDITKGKKPSCTPYADRADLFKKSEDAWRSCDTESRLFIKPYKNGLIFQLESHQENVSEYGINLPFNFMGKLNGGGWENQFLFNSPYTSPDKNIIYAYLTKPNGNNLVVAILSEADGWKMDYSPFSFGHFFVNLKLLANYDRAYGTKKRKSYLKFAIMPVGDFDSCLKCLSELYALPFLSYDLSGGKIGTTINLRAYNEPDSIIEIVNGKESVYNFTPTYTLHGEGEITLIPVKNGKPGGAVTVYAYDSLESLYKKSMDAVSLDTIKKHTDSNLCEHQCWASAMLRFLMKHKELLSKEELEAYESKLLSLLNIITEKDESLAVPRITIFNKARGTYPAYNVFESRRVQELFFGITILLDAYRYFGDEKYYEYATNATDCLLDNYQKQDGRIEVDWGNNCTEDYTTVCCAMIPILDMANFLKDIDGERSSKYFDSAKKMAEHLYKRGLHFPTEGGVSKESEEEMEDGSISCTALALLYYCKNGVFKQEYLEKAKEILDIHDSWVIKAPVCQMNYSTLRWWETQWEGDADGPAICAGHAWTIWRSEADYLYYALTKDTEYLRRAKNGFMTNFSKIQPDGTTYSIYNPDEINGGGFNSLSDTVRFRIANRYADICDCGISRYPWIRINDTAMDL